MGHRILFFERAISGLIFGLAIGLIMGHPAVIVASTSILFALICGLIAPLTEILLSFIASTVCLSLLYSVINYVFPHLNFSGQLFLLLSILLTLFLASKLEKKDILRAGKQHGCLQTLGSTLALLISISYRAHMISVPVKSQARFLVSPEDNDAWLNILAKLHVGNVLELSHSAITYISSVIPGILINISFIHSGLNTNNLDYISSSTILLSTYGLYLISIPIIALTASRFVIGIEKQVIILFSFGILLIEAISEFIIKYGSLDAATGLFFLIISILLLAMSERNDIQTRSSILIIPSILALGAGDAWAPACPISFLLIAYIIYELISHKKYIATLLLLIGTVHLFISFKSFADRGIKELLTATGGTARVDIFFILTALTLLIYFFVTELQGYNSGNIKTIFFVLFSPIIYLVTLFIYGIVKFNTIDTYSIQKTLYFITFAIIPILLVLIFNHLNNKKLITGIFITVLMISPVSGLTSSLVNAPNVGQATTQWLDTVNNEVSKNGSERLVLCINAQNKNFYSSWDSYFCNRYSYSIQGYDNEATTDWRLVQLGALPVNNIQRILSKLSNNKITVIVFGTKNQIELSDAWYKQAYKKFQAIHAKFIFLNEKYSSY